VCVCGRTLKKVGEIRLSCFLNKNAFTSNRLVGAFLFKKEAYMRFRDCVIFCAYYKNIRVVLCEKSSIFIDFLHDILICASANCFTRYNLVVDIL